MTTTRDIIERAYRKLGVVASDDPMTADQGDNGLDALNMMMHGWELDGIALGHVDLALDDDFSMVAMFHEGVVYQLAMRLGHDGAVQAPDSDAWFRKLQAHYLVLPDTTLPSPLLYTSSQYRGRR